MYTEKSSSVVMEGNYPVGIWCQNDVVSTSMRRDHVASTLIRRHFNTKYPLGTVNGSHTFGTMKICSRQGDFELMSVNHSTRSEGIIRIPVRRCDSNKYTQYTTFNMKKKITLN